MASDLSDSLFNPSHLLQAPSSEGETSPPLANYAKLAESQMAEDEAYGGRSLASVLSSYHSLD